jgi:hypothetical protein
VAQEPEGSSPHSQQPATGPCPEPVDSNPHPEAKLPKIHSDPIFPPTPWSDEWVLSFGLSHQNLAQFSVLSMRATFPAHLIRLGLTCLMISGDEKDSLQFTKKKEATVQGGAILKIKLPGKSYARCSRLKE